MEYVNFYECPDCSTRWNSAWFSSADEECPECGIDVEVKAHFPNVLYTDDEFRELQSRAYAPTPA